MDKQQPHPDKDNAMAFNAMVHLMRTFSKSSRDEPLWQEIKEHLWRMERNRRKSKEHFYTYKKLPYFCKRIDAYLDEDDNLRLKFSTLLTERHTIGLKMQLVLNPVLSDKIEKWHTAFPDETHICGNAVSRWERSKNDAQKLAHFIKKNFGKTDVEISFLQGIKQEVQSVLNDLNLARITQHEANFKISPDGKHGYFFKSDETEKWKILNHHFFETNLTYDQAYLSIQLEESLFKKDHIRFPTLYKILYPKTQSATIFARISDIVFELEDLQGLLVQLPKK